MVISPRHNLMVTLTSIQVTSMRTPILRNSQPEQLSISMAASAFRSFLLLAVRPATSDRKTTNFLTFPQSAPRCRLCQPLSIRWAVSGWAILEAPK